MTTILDFCFTGIAGILGLAYLLDRIDAMHWWAGAAVLNVGWFLLDVAGGHQGDAVMDGVGAVICVYMWWRSRRNGRWKKAAREFGAKSMARVQALVDQLTPSPIPSPAGAATAGWS